MAAKTGLTTASQISVSVRELDFATRFGKNWTALREIMGIMRPIRKTPGTKLVSYKAEVDGGLKGGSTVAEGDEIPLTKLKVSPVTYSDVTIYKRGRSVSLEAVDKYGAEIAVAKTDEAFLNAIENGIMADFYTFLLTGSLTATETSWQRALAMAKGAVLNKFASLNLDVTEVVGFANIMDAYDYIGDKDITIQTAFGINYVQDFLGYKTLFLLPNNLIPSTKVVAVPVENINLYYIDPSDTNYAQLGLEYRTDGETNLIGVHVEGDYSRATGDMWVIYGMKLWAEYLDGIAVYTVSEPTEEEVGGLKALSDTAAPTPDLDSMTKDQLLEYAQNQGVTGVNSAMLKADILATIKGEK